MKIGLLHYSYAPIIGGVESIMEQHAAIFANHGHDVTVICGEGRRDDPRVRVISIPELRPDHPLTIHAGEELLTGCPGVKFERLKSRLVTALSSTLEQMDTVFLHNVLTMHFHLALTAALWEFLSGQQRLHVVAWTHDLAARNPDYAFGSIDRSPWDLLKKRHPLVEYVAVSRHRQRQFIELTGTSIQNCAVVPNGIDPVSFLGLTAQVADFVRDRRILENQIVLIQPARILKRKNIELGLRVAAEIKFCGKTCVFMVTGPPDAHNTETVEYRETLVRMRREIGLQNEFLIIHDFFTVTKHDLISLYRVADVLFYPSRQEGFGLPLLEGALHGIPVFCSEIEPMKSMATDNVTLFNLDASPATIADIILTTISQSPTIQARKKVMRDYSWDGLYSKHLEPLLKIPNTQS